MPGVRVNLVLVWIRIYEIILFPKFCENRGQTIQFQGASEKKTSGKIGGCQCFGALSYAGWNTHSIRLASSAVTITVGQALGHADQIFASIHAGKPPGLQNRAPGRVGWAFA